MSATEQGVRGGLSRTTGQAALAAVALAVTASMGHAAVLVNDTWKDGTDTDPGSPAYSEMGVDSDADNDVESAWFRGGTGTLDPVGPGGPLRGNLGAGGTSSGSWTTYFTPEGTPVTLAQQETLRLTWRFTPTNVDTLGNTSQNFRLALVDSPAGARLASDGAPGEAAYAGYAMLMNMATTLGNSNPFRLTERNVASGNLLSSSGNWAGLANGATAGNDGYDSGAEYTFVMELTRTLADELAIDVTMSGAGLDGDGVASVSFVDATPNTFTYDTFSLRPSSATGTAEIFDTSQFTVEYDAIPEPSALAVLGLGAAGALRRRSRAR